MSSLKQLIQRMPKAELHMHLEGSLEPDLMFRLAGRNGITLPYASEEELRGAYRFSNLQSFLDVYYAGLTVLLTERDFHDMTRAYLQRAHADNVVHAEVFISPQAHTRRGVPLAAVIEGIDSALTAAQREWGMSSRLILGIQRQWTEDWAGPNWTIRPGNSRARSRARGRSAGAPLRMQAKKVPPPTSRKPSTS
jgi:adenosine deaminase